MSPPGFGAKMDVVMTMRTLRRILAMSPAAWEVVIRALQLSCLMLFCAFMLLVEALRRAGATFEGAESSGGEAKELSAADMYALGLSGRPGSAALRAALLAELGLPGKLQGASLRGVLSALYTREELERALSALPAPQ